MAPWPFVLAAYAISVSATAGLLLLSWRAMRNAERRQRDKDRP